jgi:hypothetical protein
MASVSGVGGRHAACARATRRTTCCSCWTRHTHVRACTPSAWGGARDHAQNHAHRVAPAQHERAALLHQQVGVWRAELAPCMAPGARDSSCSMADEQPATGSCWDTSTPLCPPAPLFPPPPPTYTVHTCTTRSAAHAGSAAHSHLGRMPTMFARRSEASSNGRW